MVEKKAQIKIQQMAFMLIAVTLFFVLVGMFVLVFKFSGLKEEANEAREQNAMLLVAKIANSPEFSCGSGFGGERVNCVDSDKIMAVKKNIKKYNDFWGADTNIVIRKIYTAPNRTSDSACEFSNYPNCNIINLEGKNISGEYSNFVAVCRWENKNNEIYEKCELGKIMVSYGGII